MFALKRASVLLRFRAVYSALLHQCSPEDEHSIANTSLQRDFIIRHLIDQDWGNIWKVNAKTVWPLLPGRFPRSKFTIDFSFKKSCFGLFYSITQDWFRIDGWNSSDIWTSVSRRHKLDDVIGYCITLNQSLIFVKNHNSWTTCWIYTSSDRSLKGQQTLHTIWPPLTSASGSNRNWKISKFHISKTTSYFNMNFASGYRWVILPKLLHRDFSFLIFASGQNRASKRTCLLTFIVWQRTIV